MPRFGDLYGDPTNEQNILKKLKPYNTKAGCKFLNDMITAIYNCEVDENGIIK